MKIIKKNVLTIAFVHLIILTDHLQAAAELRREEESHAVAEGALSPEKQNELNTKLLEAVNKGCSSKKVRSLIQEGAHINIQDSDGCTPLRIAIGSSHFHLVPTLLTQGADPDMPDRDGHSPLMVATLHGAADVVKQLLDRGANIHAVNAQGVQALLLSARLKSNEVAELLLARKADVNALTPEKVSTLHGAICEEQGHTIKTFIAYKADPNAPLHSSGNPPLILAAAYQNPSATQALLDGNANPDITTGVGITPLMVAAQGGNIKVATELLKKKANINVRTTEEGSDALEYALTAKHMQVVSLLLAHKADTSTPNKNKSAIAQLPLTRAVFTHDIDAIKTLFAGGADANVAVADGITPLMLAAYVGNAEIVKLLLKRGAHVNAQDNEGNTPLAYAFKQNQTNTMAILLNHKADPYIIQDGKKIPLIVLAGNSRINENTIDVLLKKKIAIDEKNVNSVTALMIASESGNLKRVQSLLEKKASIDTTNEKGETALIMAAKQGNTDVVKRLLMEKSDIHHASTDIQATALLWAARGNHSETVALLLAEKADVNAKNCEGMSSLRLVAKFGHTDVARRLIDAHAEIDPIDNKGGTPLKAAAANNHAEVAQLLVFEGADLNRQYTDDNRTPFESANEETQRGMSAAQEARQDLATYEHLNKHAILKPFLPIKSLAILTREYTNAHTDDQFLQELIDKRKQKEKTSETFEPLQCDQPAQSEPPCAMPTRSFFQQFTAKLSNFTNQFRPRQQSTVNAMLTSASLQQVHVTSRYGDDDEKENIRRAEMYEEECTASAGNAFDPIAPIVRSRPRSASSRSLIPSL